MRKMVSLLLGAAAAYGIYKYYKMSPAERNELKAKGKNILDKQMSNLENLFGKRSTADSNYH